MEGMGGLASSNGSRHPYEYSSAWYTSPGLAPLIGSSKKDIEGFKTFELDVPCFQLNRDVK